jgi:hypothetical protein
MEEINDEQIYSSSISVRPLLQLVIDGLTTMMDGLFEQQYDFRFRFLLVQHFRAGQQSRKQAPYHGQV